MVFPVGRNPLEFDTVCFFNSNREWGGGELWHLTAALALQARGWRVAVVADKRGALAARVREHAGLELLGLRLGNASFLNPLTLVRLARWFRRQGIQVLVSGLPGDLKAGGLAARLAGVPRVLYRRGLAAPVRDSLFNRFLYRRVIHGLIVNSLDTRDMVLRNNPDLLPSGRIHLLYNGIDIAPLSAAVSGAGHGGLPPKAPGELWIGSAGRLTGQKDQARLLDLAALLKARDLPFTLLLAGQGPLRATLEARARQLDVADRVRFLGFVSDMPAFYAAIDVFVLTSRWEGFGYALVEAMATARPVAAFAVSSVPEIVLHERTGYLAAAGDVQALAAYVQTLLEAPQLREQFGRAGQQRARDCFSLAAMVERLEGILRGRPGACSGDRP